MPPEILDAIAPLIAVFAMGSFILIGMKLRYNHLRDTKHAPGKEELERVSETVELLQDQVRVLRDEMVELNERVDFTERVLTRGRENAQEGGG
ncbi:MAG: hypothetical protein PVF27_10335 [Gemmatimonadales bacterium]|jgi:hypothetical protein